MEARVHKLFTDRTRGEPLKKTEIGPVPENWRVVPIRQECVDCAFGPRFSSKEYVADGAITTLRTTDMDDDGQIDLTHAPRADLDPTRFASHFLRIGDIVVSRSGTCGIASVFEGYERPVLPGAFLIRLRMRDAVWPQYLRHYLNSPQGRARTALIAEGAIQKNISGTRLQDFLIPLPPLDEQRQIAAVLSAVQRAIERQERLIALTAELKKALMHKLFTEGTRGEPLKQTEIGPVPKSWGVVRLDQIATIERGKFAHRPRNAPEFYGGKIPFVQTGDVSKCDGRIRGYTQTLNERGLAISRMFPRGTILITIAANIGYTGILDFDSACTDSLVAITPTRGDCAEFLNHYLQTQQPAMDRIAPQGTQKNINIQFLKPWPIPRPSTNEQAAISEALNQVDLKRRSHERMRDSLAALFRTLLHQLMTAQLRVRDLDLCALETGAPLGVT